MKRSWIWLVFLLVGSTIFTGCDTPMGTVKGTIVNDGQPKKFPASAFSVELSLEAPGDAKSQKTYTAVVNEDGSFEVLASGGQIQPGTYNVTVIGPPERGKKSTAKFEYKTKVDIKAGSNVLNIDLAKQG